MFARLLVIATVLVQLAGRAHAYKLEPISRVFTPSGSTATQSFEITNDGTERIALTVSILTLERDELYVETNHDADDDFLVYPPQLVLSPGKHQTLRITWLGDPKPTRELVYRLVVKQVPIQVLDKTAPAGTDGEVHVMVTYRGTLFIRPPKAAPAIGVEARPEGPSSLVLTLVNRGTAVGLVRHCAVSLQPVHGKRVELPDTDLAAIHDQRVLAGGRRRYTIPWPAGLAVQPVKAIGRCGIEP